MEKFPPAAAAHPVPSPAPATSAGLAARFFRDRSGQSMLFTALTIFTLVVVVGVIIGVGEVASTQMRIQNAADASAYSAAAVQADCLAQIAWLNEGAAAIYGKCAAQAVSNTTAFTQAYLNKAWYNPGPANGSGLNLADADTTAPLNAPPSLTPANPWLNESGRDWYERIVRIERLIAVLAPILIKNQVYQTAHANYFTTKDGKVEKPLRLAIYPNPGNTDYPAWSFYPENGSFHDAVLKQDPDDPTFGATKGWWITSETDPGYEMKILHVVIDEPKDNGTYNKWNILHDVPDTKDESGATKQNALNMTIDEITWNPFTPVAAPAGAVVYKGTVYQQADFTIDVNGDVYEVQTYAETTTGAVVMVNVKKPDGKTYLVEKTTEGSYINGVSYTLDANGNFMVNGKKIEGGMSINGLPVPVRFPMGMDGISFNWPVELRIVSPNGRGQLYVEFGSTTKIRYLFNWNIGWIYANDKEAHVRRLSTLRPDLRWSAIDGEQGRRYHRLFEYEPEARRYKYEITNVGTYTQDMSLRKLGFRALMVDSASAPLPSALKSSGYVPLAAIPRQYYDYKNKKYRWAPDDTKWARRESSVWDLLAAGPLWACPPRTAGNLTEASQSGAFGGFFDLNTGQYFNYYQNTTGAKVSVERAYAYSRTAAGSPYGKSFAYTTLPKALCANAYFLETKGASRGMLFSGTNPLWSYYASFTEENDLSDIRFYSEDVKKSCGFYIVGVYADTAAGRAQLFDAVDRIMSNTRRADNTDWPTISSINENSVPAFVADVGKAVGSSGSGSMKYYLPYFIYQESGSTAYNLALWDPYGAVALYKNQPKYPYSTEAASGIADLYAYEKAGTSPTWDEIKTIVGHCPAVVRRYAYHGLGINTDPASADFLSAGMELDIGTMMLGKLKALPLELTSQVFRNPIVVCAWMPQQISWLAPIFGKSRDSVTAAQRRTGLGNPLHVTTEVKINHSDKWGSGHFAFAAARVFFRPHQSDSFITNFAYCGNSYQDTSTTAGKQANAGLPYPNFVDSITRQNMSGYRQRWLGSLFNLFEPEWTAALVPFNASLKLEDVVPDSEFIASNDSPAGFLLRQFHTAAANAHSGRHNTRDGWMKNAYEMCSAWSYEDQDANQAWVNITAPPLLGDRKGQRVDWSDEEMQDLILH